MNTKIAILTSGGDAPGMNAAIKSIVEIGIKNNFIIYGVYNGFLGLYQKKILLLNNNHVSNIINKGGTFLGSSRFEEFKDINIRLKVINILKNKNIDVLIVIGGEGSYIGAKKLTKMNFPCITLPGTIDNDISGTDYTIGYFTALQTIVNSIDKIQDTLSSHQRILILEVMGRKCGNLALLSGIAGSCEFIILPEIKFNKFQLIKNIKKKIKNNKKHIIILITENIYNLKKLAVYIEKITKKETRITSLGYIQRGGSPVVFDRILAYRMGFHAIKLIKNNILGKCIGIKNDIIISYNLLKKIKTKKNINKKLLKLINYL